MAFGSTVSSHSTSAARSAARTVPAAASATALLLLGCSCDRHPSRALPSAVSSPDSSSAALSTMLPGLALDYQTPVHPALQIWLESLDASLRKELAMTEADTAAGLLDLRSGRLALVRPDRIEYAASIAKIGILLAWFDLHPAAAASGQVPPETARALGLMTKCSSNGMAATFTREMGLRRVQAVLHRHGFYDAGHGGGLWVGRHYGQSSERYGDPLADHSHAATVRQVLRFFLLMEQDRLVSPAASAAMRAAFDSPDLPHDPIKFVKGLSGRPVHLRRKWGTWQDWRHDAAAITGPGRHYLLTALTHHHRGDEYLERLAAAVDDRLAPADSSAPAGPASPE